MLRFPARPLNDRVHDREGNVAALNRITSSDDLFDHLIPVREPRFGMRQESAGIRQSRFELPDSPLEIGHAFLCSMVISFVAISERAAID